MSLLSKRLSKTAIETRNDPVSQFAALIEAKRLAVAAGDINTAFQVTEQLTNIFDLPTFAEYATLAESFDLMASSFTVVKELSRKLFPSIEQAVLADDLNSAQRLVATAQAVAVRLADRSQQDNVKAVGIKLDELIVQRTAYFTAAAKLEREPNDRESKKIVGIYLGLRAGDWEAAERLIAAAKDQELHQLFIQQIQLPETPTDRLALADAWWSWGNNQTGIPKDQALGIARDWYVSAAGDLSGGLAKRRAEERIQSVAADVLPTRLPPKPGPEAANTEPPRLPEDVVLYLPFDDGTATGKHGRAVELESSSRLTVEANGLPDGNSPRSILFWMKTSQRGVDVVPFRYGKLAALDAVYIFLPGYDRGTKNRPGYLGTGRVVVGSVNGGPAEFSGGAPINDDKWHHIAFVYDGEGQASLYIDGKRIAQTSRTFRTTPTSTIQFGRYDDGPSMIGAIDDFVIFSRAVNTLEIKNIMNDSAIKTLEIR